MCPDMFKTRISLPHPPCYKMLAQLVYTLDPHVFIVCVYLQIDCKKLPHFYPLPTIATSLVKKRGGCCSHRHSFPPLLESWLWLKPRLSLNLDLLWFMECWWSHGGPVPSPNFEREAFEWAFHSSLLSEPCHCHSIQSETVLENEKPFWVKVSHPCQEHPEIPGFCLTVLLDSPVEIHWDWPKSTSHPCWI